MYYEDVAVRIYNAIGVRQTELTDFESLYIAQKVNFPGSINLVLRGDHPLVSSVDLDWQFEAVRKIGANWVVQLTGLFRYIKYDYSDRSIVTLVCPGINSLLSRRYVMYKAGAVNRCKFVGSTSVYIMRVLVNYNIGANATIVNGRIRDGVMSGFTVPSSAYTGNTIDWYCAYDNLLETLQEMDKISGLDFAVVKTGSASYEFRIYNGQLGTDRSATVKFALNLGNMGAPSYEIDRLDEKTVAVVGGQERGSDRVTATVTGPDYSASNDIEMFVDATDVETTDGLTDRGEQELAAAAKKESFMFKVLQTPACRYGVHYFLGDLVTAINPFSGASSTLKIDEVYQEFSPENPAGKVEIGTTTP